MKLINPAYTFNIRTRLEVLLGLKLSGFTNTLTEANNLIDELYRRSDLQTEQQCRIALDKIYTKYTELPCKMLEQITFNTMPKSDEHTLIFVDKSTHDENLSQPLQTNIKNC